MSRAQRVQDLMDAAGKLAPEERGAYLDTACAGDSELREEIETRLAAKDEAPTADVSWAVPSPPRVKGDGSAPSSAVIQVGSHVGRYKLLQCIGEGGFGSVYMAQQQEPVSRKVAVKIIKLGMDTRMVVARFEQERQALAMMDHPHIARVLDAGATETGRPYFVMELVTGDPIVEFCDVHKLSIADRLELFAQVCHAVQHAHTKGIIHRDIKPSNILVSMQDGKANAKVIDFGIAKATSARLTERTLFTEHRQLIGTPEYMSPEQAQGSMDIDTRTDVYSLGVLLYELLTGTTPYSGQDLRSAAYDEIQRIIREVEPPRPSTRLNQVSDSVAAIAARRHTEPRKLGTLIRGELDWIVMKAMDKDRKRRYETANGLAMDIHRFISGEAVLAAPPGAGYRLRKFLRRHRVIVTTSAAVGVALVAGLVAFAWQAQVAKDQRDRAIIAEAQTAKRVSELAQVSKFQASMLSQIDTTDAGIALMGKIREKYVEGLKSLGVPEEEHAARIESFNRELLRVNASDTARDMVELMILKPATIAVDEQFKGQPLLDASLRSTIGTVYQSLGMYQNSLELQQSALQTRQRLLGESHVDTLSSMDLMSTALLNLRKDAEAEPYFKGVYEARARLLGENHPETIGSMGDLGNFYRSMGRYAEAEPLLVAALEKKRATLGNADRATLISMNTLGYLYVEQRILDKTEALWREAYETGRRVLGEDHRDVMVWTNNLGGLLQNQGKIAEAQTVIEEAYAKYRRVMGEDHPNTILVGRLLATNYLRQGKYAEAEALLQASVERSTRVMGPENPSTLGTMKELGSMLMQLGRFDQAQPLIEEAYATHRRVQGVAHPDTLNIAGTMATLLINKGDFVKAEALYRETLTIAREQRGPDHPQTLVTMNALGTMLVTLKRFDEAEVLLRESVALFIKKFGESNMETLNAKSALAGLLRMQGKTDEAVAMLRELLIGYRESGGEAHLNTLNAYFNLGTALRAAGKYEEAKENTLVCLNGYERAVGKDNLRTAHVRMGYARVLTDLMDFALSEEMLNEVWRVMMATPSTSLDRRKNCCDVYADLYTAWDKAEPEKGYALKSEEWKKKKEELK